MRGLRASEITVKTTLSESQISQTLELSGPRHWRSGTQQAAYVPRDAQTFRLHATSNSYSGSTASRTHQPWRQIRLVSRSYCCPLPPALPRTTSRCTVTYKPFSLLPGARVRSATTGHCPHSCWRSRLLPRELARRRWRCHLYWRQTGSSK
jgi:hypothetical protein